MLRTLEKETGFALEFKGEIFLNKAGLDTVLFALASGEQKYVLAVLYGDADVEALSSGAVWQGDLFGRKSALFSDTRENRRKLAVCLPKKGKVSVKLSEKEHRSDFSMTRFSELHDPSECFDLEVTASGKTVYLPVYVEGETAYLGTWMSKLSRSGLLGAIDFLFCNYKDIKSVEYTNTPYSALLDRGWRHNDFFMVLPESVEALRSGMTQKSRYNLKREKRIIEENFGGLSLENISAKDAPREVIDLFYKFKNATHEITREKYDITCLPITDYYLLRTGDGQIRAIALSCEQGKDVFIENHTFDAGMREYSFGKQLYEEYVEALIEKGKTGLALAGGSLDYKNRYGTFCAVVWSGNVSRSAYKTWKTLCALGFGERPRTVRNTVFRVGHIKKIFGAENSK